METNEEIFHRAFANVGGSSKLREKNPWKFEINVDEDLYRRLRKGQITTPNIPFPYISIINSAYFNAQVTKFEDKYFIGLFEGTFRFLYDLFGMMLCSPKILPDIGDVSKESELAPIFNAQFINYFQYMDVNGYTDYTPNCSIRKKVRGYLTRTSLYSIVLHEYSHIICGHLGYLTSLGKKGARFTEFTNSDSQPNGLDSILSQTLELDADNASYSTIYKSTMRYFEKPHDIDYYGSFLPNPDEALRLTTFAIYTWHRIFGMYNEDKVDLLSLSHPPSGMRQDALIDVVYTIAKHEAIIGEASRLLKIMLKTANEVELAFTTISEQPYNSKAFSLTFSPEYQAHYELLVKNIKKVEPLLEPFAYSALFKRPN